MFWEGSEEITPDSPSTSRDLIQSFTSVRRNQMVGLGVDTYQFIDIPTSVLTSGFGFVHSLSDMKVPVHVSGLLLLALGIGLEASTTLCAWYA